MEKEKKNNKKKVIIIISIILGVLLVGSLSYITYDKAFKKDNETKEETTKDENNNQEEVNQKETSTTDKIYKQFEALLSIGYFEDVGSKTSSSYFGYTLTINDNNNLIYEYSDDNDKKQIKQIEGISDASKIYYIYKGGAEFGNIILTKDGLIYNVQVDDEGNAEVTKISSNKKAERIYVNSLDEIYIVFEDKSIENLTITAPADNNYLKEEVSDLNYIITGFRFSQCGSYCPPREIIVKADGEVKILKSIDDSGKEEYVNVTYNNKELNLKYIYHDETQYDKVYSYANIYFVDTDNNVYILKDYYKDEKKPTNLEKLSYKFNIYQTNTVTSEYGYDYNEYTVKYDNGNTLKAENFIDLSKYSKVFEVFNN